MGGSLPTKMLNRGFPTCLKATRGLFTYRKATRTHIYRGLCQN